MALRPFVAVAALLAAQMVTAAAAETWGGKAFNLTPNELRQVADAVPRSPGADVTVLRREVSYTFELDHRKTWRQRLIYRIETVAGLDAWSVSEAPYFPAYQSQPRLRARVVDATSRERWLATGQDGRAPTGHLERRLLHARLPGIGVGSVVEEEVIVEETRPLFTSGIAGEHPLVLEAPIHSGRLLLSAPAELSLRYVVHKAPGLEPRRRLDDGRIELDFQYGPQAAATPAPPHLPFDVPRFPQVAFATGDSWHRIAVDGLDRVLRRLPAADRVAVASPATDRQAALARVAGLLAMADEDGAAAVASQGEEAVAFQLLGPGYERALRLLTELRAEGIAAFLALIHRGSGEDVDSELPGLGPFDHVLVWLPGEAPVWIDPMARWSRPGELPTEAQGRRALILDAVTTELVTTPVADARENRTTVTVEVHVAPQGPGRIFETRELFGAPERMQRQLTAELDAASRRSGYGDYIASVYRAARLGDLEESDPGDLSHAFRLHLEAREAGRVWSDGGTAAVAILTHDLVAVLPPILLTRRGEARQEDFLFHEPVVTEWTYRIVLPEGFEPRSLPSGGTRYLGTAELRSSFRLQGRQVVAAFRFDSGPRQITANQFAQLRDAVQAFLTEEPLVLWFDARK